LRILFTGITGLIGRYFLQSTDVCKKHQVLGTSRTRHDHPALLQLKSYQPVDYKDIDAYRELLHTFKPEVVVYAGGTGDVEEAERNNDKALFENLTFPRALIQELYAIGAPKLISFSSSMIYDGLSGPYDESSKPSPLNYYGELKQQLDQLIRHYKGPALILRPIVTYGWNFSFARKNPVTSFLFKLSRKNVVQVVSDVYENPIYAGDVAKILLSSIECGLTGELNAAGGDKKLSRYEWISEFGKAFAFDRELIKPVQYKKLQLAAQRPVDTTFTNKKLNETFDFRVLNVSEGASIMKQTTSQFDVTF